MSNIEAVTIPEGERGPWRVERFTVDPQSIEAMRLAWSGRPVHSGRPVRTPIGEAAAA